MKGLAFIVDIDESIPNMICCDQKRLQHILIHLLSNSIKYTYQGSITLSISRDLELEDCLNFTVVDTGIGMDEN